jgi:hypothetical protein
VSRVAKRDDCKPVAKALMVWLFMSDSDKKKENYG